MRRTYLLAVFATLTGCASTGIVQTGDGTYMVAKKSAAGMFTSGATVKAGIYQEASDYCAKDGRVVQTITATSANAIPFARMPQAEINFRCVAPSSAPVASAPQ